MIPLPEGTTLMHLPGRRALALDAKDRPVDVEADLLPVAAVLPVGSPAHARAGVAPPAGQPAVAALRLRGRGGASRRAPGRRAQHRRLRLVGAAAVRRRRPRCGHRKRSRGAPGQPPRRPPRHLRHRSPLLHGAEHLPAPIRGSAPRVAGVQRRLPGLHLPADRRRGAGAAAPDAIRADRRRARRHGRVPPRRLRRGDRVVRPGVRRRTPHPRRRPRPRRRDDPPRPSRGDHPRQHQREPPARSSGV